MIIDLPVLPATRRRFRGERTFHLVQETEHAPFEVAHGTGSSYPIEAELHHEGRTLAWRRHNDWLVRPILTPDGVPADLLALRNATGPALINVGSSALWWHDHPSSLDRALLWTGDPLRSPIFPQTVSRVLDFPRQSIAVTTHEAETARVGRRVNDMVVIDGVPHIRSELWGWMVRVRQGDVVVDPWIPGAPGATLSPTLFFPATERSVATEFARIARRPDRLKSTFRPSPTHSPVEGADRASLRSLLLQIHATPIGSLSKSFLDAYATARDALAASTAASFVVLLTALSQACAASGNSKLAYLGRLFTAREQFIQRVPAIDHLALGDLVL